MAKLLIKAFKNNNDLILNYIEKKFKVNKG
jgi:hypothetical protein